MKSSKKSNKVSWPPDVDLCQVRLFLSDDCPSLVGPEAQDQLQEKTSWILRSNSIDTDYQPPGFEGSHYVSQSKCEPSFIPRMNWRCPPKFVLSHNWQVATGEESKEVGSQKQRELTVLEAVYPWPSSIPSSPSVSPDIEGCHHDDHTTPVIPITPIEEDDTSHLPSDATASISSSSLSLLPSALPEGLLASGSPNPPRYTTPAVNPPATEKTALGTPPCLEADVIVAASAAFTAIMKSKEHGSLIDTNLLIKILSNPKMVEKLIGSHGATSSTDTATVPVFKPETLPPSSLSNTETDIVAPPRLADGNVSNRVQPTLTVMPIQQEAPAYKETTPMPRSRPITTMAALSGPWPSTVSSPLQAGGHLHFVPNAMLPTRSTVTPSSHLLQAPARAVAAPISAIKQVSLLDPYSISETNRALSTRQESGNMISLSNVALPPSPTTLSNQPTVPVYISAVPVYTAATRTPIMKDTSYYKNLIKQHGGERHETTRGQSLLRHGRSHKQHFQEVQNFKPTTQAKTTKTEKPCKYFNSSKGCRLGSNCPYPHHVFPYQCHSDIMLEGGGSKCAKRMKLG